MSEDLEPMQIAAVYIAHRFKHANEAPKARRQSFRDLGTRYGITHVHARSIARGNASAGKEIIQRVASRDFGGSLDELMRTATAWHQEQLAEQRIKLLEQSEPAEQTELPWIDAPQQLRYPRMRGPLLMGADRRMATDFLQRFAKAKHSNGDLLSADDWWARLQSAWTDYMISRSKDVSSEARELTSSPQLDPKLVTGGQRGSKRSD